MEKVPVQYLSYNEAEGQRAPFFILGENSSVDILAPPKYKPWLPQATIQKMERLYIQSMNSLWLHSCWKIKEYLFMATMI